MTFKRALIVTLFLLFVVFPLTAFTLLRSEIGGKGLPESSALPYTSGSIDKIVNNDINNTSRHFKNISNKSGEKSNLFWSWLEDYGSEEEFLADYPDSYELWDIYFRK